MATRLERGILSALSRGRMTNVIGPSSPGIVLSSGSAGSGSEADCMKLSAVSRAMEILSGSMAKLPTYAVNETTHERLDHPLLYLLNVRPNEAMSPAVAKSMVEGNRLSGGNGYEWIIRDPRSMRPVELIPLPWELVQRWKDTSGRPWYGVIHPYTGELMTLNCQDMIHVKGYSHNGFDGISVLSRAAEVITAGRSAQQYELSYYENSGMPSGVLSTTSDLNGEVTRTKADGTTETVTHRDVIREEWEKIHAGPKNSFRTAVLDFGLEYKPIAISNVDAQFVESRAVTVEDIARFFGVPLSKLYAGKQAYNSNEQNSIDYVVSTLHPIVTQYDEENTYKLLPDSEIVKGTRLKINMMAELKGDSSSRGTWYKNMREAGAFCVDDIRGMEDMVALGHDLGGDIYYGNKNYAPLDQFREISAAQAGGKKK